jgi:hypothetical protein
MAGTYPTDFWKSTQAANLGSKMKCNDLHMIYNPVSNLLKVFNKNGTAIRTVYATGRAGSRGLAEPHIIGQARPMSGGSNGTRDSIMWEMLNGRAWAPPESPMDRWCFVRTDYAWDDAYDRGPLNFHYWEMDPGSFVQLFHLVQSTVLSGGTVYFEIAGRHMIREDVLYAMEHPQRG